MSQEERVKSESYFFFVDDKKYETETATLTGALIKAMVVGFDNTYGLFLEGHGSEQDIPISDTTTVTLEREKGPKRFYTVPPATFGNI